MEQVQEFINRDFTFTISGISLLIAAFIGIAGILGILFLVYKTFKKINENQKPKYGFLGKPLYQMIFLLLVIGIGSSSIYFAYQESDITQTSANQDISIEFGYETIQEVGSINTIEFNINPLINNSKLSESAEIIDVYFSISGTEVITKNFTEISDEDELVFRENLVNGNYNISISVIGRDNFATFDDSFTLD